jgi:SAM-dependent methyltransferase
LSVYPNSQHESTARAVISSASTIMPFVVDAFRPASVLDVGCGFGYWLAQAKKLGVSRVVGVDGPWIAKRHLAIAAEQFREAELTRPFDLGERFDFVMSLEVAEHLPAAAARQFVRSIVGHGNCIMFGAAIPGQGGYKHLNEQWPSYWMSMFDELGFEPFDIIRPTFWQSPGVEIYYVQNTFVYVDRKAPDLIAAATSLQKGLRFPTDAVHPLKFNSVVNHGETSVRRLVGLLPRRAARAIRSRAASAANAVCKS